MKDEFIPICQVRYSAVLFYDEWQSRRKANKTSYNPYSSKAGAYSGNVSAASERRIRKAISLLLQISPDRVIYNPVLDLHHNFKINFITLTVSDTTIREHKDVYKTCLRSYLKWQARQGAEHYIWKAELQQRGQVHYHITTNCFIHYKDIRKKWNSLQRKAGYLDNFAMKYKHYDANSTDVHSVRNVKDIEAYLVKYVAKDATNGTGKVIKGKVWDCSDSLKKSYFTTIAEPRNIADAKKLCRNYKVAERYAFAPRVSKEVLTTAQLNDYLNYINSL